ncbi:MAG: DNA cytosine methyltransferase, partial [Eubacterium sp.]|nr:DNA cytosine methyltransferase [Eubacterium sp.]
RVLDSQYWGTPQRRKRIFLVGDFRAERAPQILFECESVLGYTETRRKERKGLTPAFVGDFEIAGGLDPNSCIADFGRTADRIYYNAEKARTLTATTGGGGSATGNYLDISEIRPINLQLATRCKALGERTGLGIAENGEPAYTLQEQHSHAVFVAVNYGETQPIIINDQGGEVIDISNKGTVPTLRAETHGHPPLILALPPSNPTVYPIRDPQLNQNANGFVVGNENDPAPTLSATEKHAIAACYAPSSYGTYKEGCGPLRQTGFGDSENLIVMLKKIAYWIKYELRKLTPLECERLQGYPDYWTKYGESGAELPDTPRYKALGNSLTVPCAERVFRGIIAVIKDGTIKHSEVLSNGKKE